MSEIGIEYKRIMEEIEKTISNEEERKFVKSKLAELSISFIDIIDRITKATDMKIKEMERNQDNIEKKMSSIEAIVDNIENDIYEDGDSDEDYEFEVVCPYCNYEFSVDMDNIEKDEVECPECHNVIELDWNEEHCSGSCSHCMENCLQEDEESYNSNEIDTNKKETNSKDTSKNEDDDEDM